VAQSPPAPSAELTLAPAVRRRGIALSCGGTPQDIAKKLAIGRDQMRLLQQRIAQKAQVTAQRRSSAGRVSCLAASTQTAPALLRRVHRAV